MHRRFLLDPSALSKLCLAFHPEDLFAIRPPAWTTGTTRSSRDITLLHSVRHLSSAFSLVNVEQGTLRDYDAGSRT